MSGAQPLYCKTSVWCVCVRGDSVFWASYWLYVQENDLLIRSSSGFAVYESFRKAGSLSDPHRLRAEKPGAGIDFHLLAQQTEPGGGEEKTTSPMIRNHRQVNVAPEPGCYLIRMKRRSGWGGGGSLVVWRWKKRNASTFTGWHVDCRVPCWRMSAGACHTQAPSL